MNGLLGYIAAAGLSRLQRFKRCEQGGVMEYVLIIGVISLPLVTFLSLFGADVVDWVKDHAPNIFEEAASWE